MSPKCCLCQDPTGHLGIFNRQRYLLSGLEKSGFWGQQIQTQDQVLWGSRYSEVFCLSSVGWATVLELYQDILLCSILGLLTTCRRFPLPLIMISKDFSRQGEMSPRDSQTHSFCSPSVKGAVRKGLRGWQVVVVGTLDRSGSGDLATDSVVTVTCCVGECHVASLLGS